MKIEISKNILDELNYDLQRLKTYEDCAGYLNDFFQGVVLDFEKLDYGGGIMTVQIDDDDCF